METLNYSLVSAVVSIGMICGVVIGWIAKEELKAGKKYFQSLQNILLGLILFFLIFERSLTLAAILSVLLTIVMFSCKKLKYNPAVYFLLAFAFYTASLSGLFQLVSALIFFYGFPAGSVLFYNKRTNWYWEAAVSTALFLIASNLLFLSI